MQYLVNSRYMISASLIEAEPASWHFPSGEIPDHIQKVGDEFFIKPCIHISMHDDECLTRYFDSYQAAQDAFGLFCQAIKDGFAAI